MSLPVCEDAISKHVLWRIIEDNAYWVTYNETSREKGMTLTGINQALNECPPVEPERPKGEWIPVSERLPEANEVVLLYGKYNMFCGYHNTKGEWYSITGDGWETDMDFPDSNKGDIVTWMPLPKPYKET